MSTSHTNAGQLLTIGAEKLVRLLRFQYLALVGKERERELGEGSYLCLRKSVKISYPARECESQQKDGIEEQRNDSKMAFASQKRWLGTI